MKIAFVFPGQGSQAVGMAAGFADNAAAAAVMKTADAALGESLSGLIAEGPAEKLNHPARRAVRFLRALQRVACRGRR